MNERSEHTFSPAPGRGLGGGGTLAITAGEPAGVGPELCLALAQRHAGARLVVLGDRDLLAARARAIGIEVDIRDYGDPRPGSLEVLHLPLAVPSVAGHVDPGNAPHVLALLDRAIAGCLEGEFAALVTAPLHKAVINAAGVPFTGHTEYLAEKTGAARVIMMLVGGGLRVALATTHLPLSAVPAAITRAGLEATLGLLDAEMRGKFGLERPRILVAGLNPHAGEGGHLGREEIEVIEPALSALRARGIDVIGPLPADTLFTPALLSRGDCVLAMYHDQGLPVLKYASFGGGVNVTLGLPIIRTSVDHGTALDLAGSGRADPGSLFAAVDLAVELARNRGAA